MVGAWRDVVAAAPRNHHPDLRFGAGSMLSTACCLRRVKGAVRPIFIKDSSSLQQKSKQTKQNHVFPLQKYVLKPYKQNHLFCVSKKNTKIAVFSLF